VDAATHQKRVLGGENLRIIYVSKYFSEIRRMGRHLQFFIINCLVFAVVAAVSSFAQADTHFGLDLGLIQDQKTISSRDVIQTTFYDAYIYLQANASYPFYLGFEYVYITTTQPDAVSLATATLTSSNAMAGMKYIFGKKELFSFSIMGSPVTQANYQVTGSASDLWSGTSLASKLSIHPALSPSLKLCVSLVYYSAAYASKTASSGSTTVSSFSRSLIIPTFALQYSF